MGVQKEGDFKGEGTFRFWGRTEGSCERLRLLIRGGGGCLGGAGKVREKKGNENKKV